MKKNFKTFVFALLFANQFLFANARTKTFHKIFFIWHDIKKMKKYDSALFMSRPEKANGIALLIFPGGSYHHLGLYNEGHTSARFFNSKGITTFVLRYRTASGGYRFPSQLEDAQKALHLVRSLYAEFDFTKIGVIGFSAGGHLALMTGAFPKTKNTLSAFGIADAAALTPDFIAAVYPVVSMQDTIANSWSRKSLLGKNPSQEQKDDFSVELHIPETMPPVFLLACRDDTVVNFENSILLCEALKTKNIPFNFATYETGGHGFGMLKNDFLSQTRWNETFVHWIFEHFAQ